MFNPFNRNLEKAIRFATNMHSGQVDKGGDAYILHCLRVMLRVQPMDMIVAVLHDVIEDSGSMVVELKYWFGEDVEEDVKTLSRGKDEAYNDYITRVANSNERVRAVKIADLEDHIDPVRINNLTYQQILKYKSALEVLNKTFKL